MRNGFSLALIAIKTTTPPGGHKLLPFMPRILAPRGCLLLALSSGCVKVEITAPDLLHQSALARRCDCVETSRASQVCSSGGAHAERNGSNKQFLMAANDYYRPQSQAHRRSASGYSCGHFS